MATPPITWRNVNAPSGAGALNAFNQSGRLLGQSISGIGEAIKTGAQDQADFETADFLTDLNTEPDPAKRQAMINASEAFLDPAQVVEAQKANLIEDRARAAEGRAVAEEARGVVRANQATQLFDQTFEQQKQLNPLRIREETAKVKGNELDLSINEDFARSNAELINSLNVAKEKVATATTDETIKTAEFEVKQLEDQIKFAQNADNRARDLNTRAEIVADEQTIRFDQEVVRFEQSQDERANKLDQEKFINFELSDAATITNTRLRYQHLQGIQQNARSRNMTLTPAQEAKLTRDLSKAASRLTPNDLQVELPRYTSAFTALSSRPKTLPNGQPALTTGGNPIFEDPTATEVASFAANVAQEIATANPELAEREIERLTKETMAELPGFSKIARKANLKDKVLKGADTAKVEEAINSASWNARIDETPNRQGLQNIVRDFMRTEGGSGFNTGAIDDEDLNIDIQALWNKIDDVMPEFESDSDIAKAIMRVVGASHVDQSWFGYSDVQFRTKDGSFDWMDLDTDSKKRALRDYLLSK